ncbi:hypothetical protein ACIBO2_49690 [Nonomuraea sp. NPDC050022]|uniref:hypothetical protein n=1 Tax=unclassified Nonomuraea TaxID=2593643 RepID=UPI0033EAB7D0
MEANTATCKMCEKQPIQEYNGKNGLERALLCRDHDDETKYPKKWCDGCPERTTLLTVGKEEYVEIIQFTVTPTTMTSVSGPWKFSGLSFCKPCSVAQTCRACCTPAYLAESKTPLRGAKLLAENDARCAFCASGPAFDVEACVKDGLFWIRSWFDSKKETFPKEIPNFSVKVVPANVLLAEGHGLGEKGTLLGLCKAQSVDNKITSYTIFILNGMRKAAFMETLVHELTHIWLFENKLSKKPYVEGFCNFVSINYLLSLGNDEDAGRRKNFMMANPNAFYGGDMKAYLLQAKASAFNPFMNLRSAPDIK